MIRESAQLKTPVCVQTTNQNTSMKRFDPVPGPKKAATSTKALRILVVEDHADTRRGLEVLLGVLGHHASFAGDVRTALQLAAGNNRFDLLLSDIGLPDGTGWDLLRDLEQMDRRPAVAVAISGFNSCSDIEKSQAAGFRTHLVKPFAPEELVTVLNAVAAELAKMAEVLAA